MVTCGLLPTKQLTPWRVAVIDDRHPRGSVRSRTDPVCAVRRPRNEGVVGAMRSFSPCVDRVN